MDTELSSMDIANLTPTATGAIASATTAAVMDMDMGMGGCKISMLWNWETVDSCFIAKSWHVTSKGMFAGCCIGVILLVMSLEFLRRASREFDRSIVRGAERDLPLVTADTETRSPTASSRTKAPQPIVTSRQIPRQFRPSLLQQVIRALLHMVQFAVAYFIMLLAMYYNGYIIISIIIGAFLGAFVFSWEPITLSSDDKEEATLCCG